MSTLLAPFESYIWAALLLIVLAGGLYACHRLETIGANEVKTADAAARADEQKKTAADTAALQVMAEKATEERDVAQKALSDYLAAHPVSPVLVYHGPANSGRGLSSAPSIDSGPAGACPDAGDLGNVLVGGDVPPTDISPELDTIVRSAGAMAGLYQQFQHQPVIKDVR